TCPQKYWDLYPAESIQMPANAKRPPNAPEPAFHNNYELRSYGTVPDNGKINAVMAHNLIRGYRACVSFMDAQLGKVIAELDRLGLRENTAIVLWGDRGYHLGEQSVWTKMTNFEHGTRVPLLVSLPGMKTAGQRTKALVELVDLYPTLASVCSLPLPPHLEGSSFAPLLEEPDQPWKKAVFSQYLRTGKPPFMGRSIRTPEWRYTEWDDGKRGVELYDCRRDPDELNNLAGQSLHAATESRLKDQLHKGWRAALPR
ncbi:MAG: sulfatase-like hydrolase/transferase, partial [Bryobacterales bacterium]|nr:sulfatase-like hydrolase/transferase [Bryobacterales bacterium]